MTNPSSMPDLTSAIALKIAGKLIESTVPQGLEIFKAGFLGKTIVIVGNSSAGKTCFLNYLQFGVLEEEDEHRRTVGFEDRRKPFILKVGTTNSLEIRIKSAIEIPGQVGAEEQANVVYTINPKGILIFTDLTEPDRSLSWLERFCTSLEDCWRGERNEIIQSIIIVLNKKDKSNQTNLDKCKSDFLSVVSSKLAFARGNLSIHYIQALPCVSVINPEQTKYIDKVIFELVKDLSRR